jgi:hypothetical protein
MKKEKERVYIIASECYAMIEALLSLQAYNLASYLCEVDQSALLFNLLMSWQIT